MTFLRLSGFCFFVSHGGVFRAVAMFVEEKNNGRDGLANRVVEGLGRLTEKYYTPANVRRLGR